MVLGNNIVTFLFILHTIEYSGMSVESDAVKTVAGLMALAARTAPKAVGIDSIIIEVVSGEIQQKIAEKMIEIGAETGMDFFRINGEQVKKSDVTVLIGVSGCTGLGLNCGGCGYPTCKEMIQAIEPAKSNQTDYRGPNCVFKVSDLWYCRRFCCEDCQYSQC